MHTTHSGGDAGATTTHLVLEEVGVPGDGVHVAAGAHLILEHLLVDAEVGVRVEVVVGAGQVAVLVDLALLRSCGGVTAVRDC